MSIDSSFGKQDESVAITPLCRIQRSLCRLMMVKKPLVNSDQTSKKFLSFSNDCALSSWLGLQSFPWGPAMYGAAAIATDVMLGPRSRQRSSAKESPVLQHSSADCQPTAMPVEQDSIRAITGIPDLWLAVAAAALPG